MTNLSVSKLGLNRAAYTFWLRSREVELVTPNEASDSVFPLEHWRYKYIFDVDEPEELSFPEPYVLEKLGLDHLEVDRFYDHARKAWHAAYAKAGRPVLSTKHHNSPQANAQHDSSCSKFAVSDIVAAARMHEHMTRLRASQISLTSPPGSTGTFSGVKMKPAHSRTNEFHWRHPIDQFLDDIMRDYRKKGCELFFEPNWKAVNTRLGSGKVVSDPELGKPHPAWEPNEFYPDAVVTLGIALADSKVPLLRDCIERLRRLNPFSSMVNYWNLLSLYTNVDLPFLMMEYKREFSDEDNEAQRKRDAAFIQLSISMTTAIHHLLFYGIHGDDNPVFGIMVEASQATVLVGWYDMATEQVKIHSFPDQSELFFGTYILTNIYNVYAFTRLIRKILDYGVSKAELLAEKRDAYLRRVLESPGSTITAEDIPHLWHDPRNRRGAKMGKGSQATPEEYWLTVTEGSLPTTAKVQLPAVPEDDAEDMTSESEGYTHSASEVEALLGDDSGSDDASDSGARNPSESKEVGVEARPIRGSRGHTGVRAEHSTSRSTQAEGPGGAPRASSRPAGTLPSRISVTIPSLANTASGTTAQTFSGTARTTRVTIPTDEDVDDDSDAFAVENTLNLVDVDTPEEQVLTGKLIARATTTQEEAGGSSQGKKDRRMHASESRTARNLFAHVHMQTNATGTKEFDVIWKNLPAEEMQIYEAMHVFAGRRPPRERVANIVSAWQALSRNEQQPYFDALTLSKKGKKGKAKAT